MARTKKTVQVMDTLELTYNLAELPSSQHRAGLAGLVLMVQWLHRFEEWKQDGAAICEIENLSDRFSIRWHRDPQFRGFYRHINSCLYTCATF